ncbi:MAG: RnfABCDGE type electron transport complex subunit G [bacterium]
MKEPVNLALRLGLICAVAALALTQVDAFTREPIALAEARAQREAVAAVLPPFTELVADTLRPGEADQALYFTGMGPDGPVGTALVTASGLGYSGLIELMLGLDAKGNVNGVRVLRHAETPGLGANYAAPELLDRFYKGRPGGGEWKVTKDGGPVDAVTGATVTGRAICDAIDRGWDRWSRDRDRLGAPGKKETP